VRNLFLIAKLVVASARNCRSRVIPKNTRFPTLIVNVLCLDGDTGLQTSGESGAVGEFDMHLGTVCAIFIDGDEVHDFVAQFFALNHRYPILFGGSQRGAAICVRIETHRILAGSDLLRTAVMSWARLGDCAPMT
jgi:hypothetical protein